MIASIQGVVAATGKDYAVIATNNGIGYKVFVPHSALERLHDGSDAFLHTTLIVREESLTLYGFDTTTERTTPRMLASAWPAAAYIRWCREC